MTLRMPLYAAVCRSLPPRERKSPLFLASLSVSQAEGRRFEPGLALQDSGAPIARNRLGALLARNLVLTGPAGPDVRRAWACRHLNDDQHQVGRRGFKLDHLSSQQRVVAPPRPAPFEPILAVCAERLGAGGTACDPPANAPEGAFGG